MKMKRAVTGMLVATTAAILCGCSGARPSKYYQLTVPAEMKPGPPAQAFPVTLLIAPLTSAHLYRGDQVVYSNGSEMGTYAYHRWAEPPTEMVEQLLIRQLRESGRYRAVYPQSSSAHGDFVIRGSLYDFKEVSGSNLCARVTIELELLDVNSGATVWTHYFTHDEPIAHKDVSAVIAALDQSTQRGINELAASLGQYFEGNLTK
jgi:ABC-type uncharacterized transport system auxiliary subunit